jgi:hypothetical protein
MKYARPLLITFSVVIAVSVAIAVAAAVAIAVTILNGLTVYNNDSNDPITNSSTFTQDKKPKAIDDESFNNTQTQTDQKPGQKTASIVENKATVEPSAENADMPATGEFADQINLLPEKIACSNACIDDTNVSMPAMGEFADQINSDAIVIAAKEKGFDVVNDDKLMDVTVSSHPPTELGVYTPPTAN